MENLDFSPKLKNAMEEIKQILDKYDIGGFIVLHTPEYGEHYMKLNPSYSALELKPREGIVMKGRNNFKGNKETHLKAIADSLNLLRIIIDLGIANIYPLLEISKKMDEYYNAEHNKGKHTGHDELFN